MVRKNSVPNYSELITVTYAALKALGGSGKKYITERASDISKRMNTEMVDDSSEIALEIDSVFEKWEQLAENFDEEHFYYGEKFLIKEPDDGEGRLMKPFNTSRNDPAFDTMTSMRNVDSTVAGNVLIWEEV